MIFYIIFNLYSTIMVFRVNITGLLRRQNYESGGGEWGPFRESNRECIVKVDSKKGYKNIASMNLFIYSVVFIYISRVNHKIFLCIAVRVRYIYSHIYRLSCSCVYISIKFKPAWARFAGSSTAPTFRHRFNSWKLARNFVSQCSAALRFNQTETICRVDMIF